MRNIAFFTSVLVALVVMAGCEKPQQYVKSSGEMLGTFMQVTALTEAGSDVIYDRMMSLDKEAKASMSIFDESSLLSRVNRNETDSLDAHIIHCLELARRVTERSGG